MKNSTMFTVFLMIVTLLLFSYLFNPKVEYFFALLILLVSILFLGKLISSKLSKNTIAVTDDIKNAGAVGFVLGGGIGVITYPIFINTFSGGWLFPQVQILLFILYVTFFTAVGFASVSLLGLLKSFFKKK